MGDTRIKESAFQRKVIKFLKEQGCYVIKYWGGGKFTTAGVPDLLVCCNGRFIGIELKAENGKASELQLWHLKQINKSGGMSYLLYPKDFEKFKRVVRDLCSTHIQG